MDELVFSPSDHSFRSEAAYHGWLQNLGSKEGRAENKLTRAKKMKKVAKKAKKVGGTRASESLRRRAGILTAKAKGKQSSLHPKSSYSELWASEFPWAERKRMPYTGLTGTAKGYRPSASQVRQEWRGTILGGLSALKAAGVEGYTEINVESLPTKMVQGAGEDKQLVQAVAAATGKKFKGSLQRASAEIRSQVVQHGLGEVAWPARAVPMLGSSMKRLTIFSTAAVGASVGLKAASGIVAGTGLAPPWIQNIVTGPAAASLIIFSFAADALGAGAAVKKGVAEGASEKYIQDFSAGLEQWAFDKDVGEVQRQVREAQARAEFQKEVARKVGTVKGQEAVDAVTVLAWAGGISFGLIATSAVVRHIRSRA